MAFLAFLLGSLTALVGFAGIVAPGTLGAAALALRGPLGLVLGTVFRRVRGATLFRAAGASRGATCAKSSDCR